MTLETRSFGCLRDPGTVPGDLGNPESSGWLREYGVLRVTPGTRSSGDSGNTEFGVTPGARSSG